MIKYRKGGTLVTKHTEELLEGFHWLILSARKDYPTVQLILITGEALTDEYNPPIGFIGELANITSERFRYIPPKRKRKQKIQNRLQLIEGDTSCVEDSNSKR